jgi:hypothetical protein
MIRAERQSLPLELEAAAFGRTEAALQPPATGRT